MKLKDRIAAAFGRLAQRVAGVDWNLVGRKVARFMNRVMHKILFGWLLPKKDGGLKKGEICELMF